MVSSLSPSDIRSIRQRLNLSQAEAGEVIGGGPRAFQKYESGTVRPSASVVRLLRLLDENPAALGVLRGEREAGPFEVDGGRLVGAIPPQAFPSLLRRLLSAEAQAHGLPQYGIHVADDVTAADGGEDGRIQWTEGPSRTEFLPGRLCQFQMKTGNLSPAAAAKEVLGRDGRVKRMIRSVLDRGGYYILLCAQTYTQQQIQDREDRIRSVLGDAGKDVDEERIRVRGAEQLAHWINHYPSVAIWVNEWTSRPVGPFRSSDRWRRRMEHETLSWVEDERLPALQKAVLTAAAHPGRAVRVVGASGIGKSRLALEALAPTAEARRRPIADLVMYADLSESAPTEINRAVQSLVDNRQRAVVVADNCPPESHRILAGSALQAASCVSLVTIDDDFPPEIAEGSSIAVDSREAMFRLPEAPAAVVENVIGIVCRELPSEDFRRLTRFSQGNPKIAHKVAQVWRVERPVAYAADEDIAEDYVAGRRTSERNLLLKAARLLAAFQLVALDADQNDGSDDLEEVASFGAQIADDDLRSMYELMIDRGVVRRHGRFATLEPRAIAVRLAARQWRNWSKAKRRTVLGGGSTSRALKVSAAKQLALLSDTELGQEVVRDVCHPGGPFDGRDGLLRPGHAEVLHSLAQIDPSSVVDGIERSLDEIVDLRDLPDNVRRELVRTLEKIAFAAESFDAGARLLLRLALTETEPWENNATRQFKALFPLVLGNTAADGEARHELLEDLCSSDDPEQRKILVEALIDGTRVDRFSRSVGAEIHGARPALEPWHPPTQEAVLAYLEACVAMLSGFASGTGPVADIARKGLGGNLRSLASRRFIDLVEQAVETVAPHCELWLEGREALAHFIAFHVRKMPENDERRKTEARIRSLMSKLEPQSLPARLRTIVTDVSWDQLIEDDGDDDFDFQRIPQRQDDAVRKFAMEMLQRPNDLREILPDLARWESGGNRRRMTSDFGKAVAEHAVAPLDWRNPILDAVLAAPDGARDFDLLAGYVSGLPDRLAAEAEAVKRLAAEEPALVPGFPNLCWRRALVQGGGIVEEDITQAISAVEAGLLHPRGLAVWGMGQVLKPLEPNIAAPLFDALLDHSPEGYETAIHLIGMYVVDRMEALEGLRPQLVKAAHNLVTQLPPSTSDPMLPYHFKTVMTWLLDQGRVDADARITAMALSSALVAEQDHDLDFMMEDLVRPLLEGFPEISWQILGGGILAKGVNAVRLRFLLGKGLSERQADPPILCLPEEVLFAWCRANGDEAAAFAAETLPFLDDGGGRGAGLHPWMSRLIQEFGGRARVRQALDSNIFSGGFGGSASSFFGRYNAALARLRDGHSSSAVRRWAGKTLQALSDTGAQYDRRDDEWNAQNEN